MTLLTDIDNDPRLFGIVFENCEENGAAITFCSDLIDARVVDAGFRILRVDQYFHSRNFPTPPAAVDCLVIVERDGGYGFYLIELKDVSRPGGLKPLADVELKFHNTCTLFIERDFRDLFCDRRDVAVVELRSWLVLGGFAGRVGDPRVAERFKGTVLDGLNLMRPVAVGGLAAPIEPRITGTEIC